MDNLYEYRRLIKRLLSVRCLPHRVQERQQAISDNLQTSAHSRRKTFDFLRSAGFCDFLAQPLDFRNAFRDGILDGPKQGALVRISDHDFGSVWTMSSPNLSLSTALPQSPKRSLLPVEKGKVQHGLSSARPTGKNSSSVLDGVVGNHGRSRRAVVRANTMSLPRGAQGRTPISLNRPPSGLSSLG